MSNPCLVSFPGKVSFIPSQNVLQEVGSNEFQNLLRIIVQNALQSVINHELKNSLMLVLVGFVERILRILHLLLFLEEVSSTVVDQAPREIPSNPKVQLFSNVYLRTEIFVQTKDPFMVLNQFNPTHFSPLSAQRISQQLEVSHIPL
jgi:hypothetical protein